MNANLYHSSNPELEAKLNSGLDDLRAEEQDLANMKAEAKTQGEKISIGFRMKANAKRQEAIKAQLKDEVKHTLDQEAVVEYILQSLAGEIDKTRDDIQNWLDKLSVDTLQYELGWAEDVAKMTEQLHVLQGLMLRFWNTQADVSTTMTLAQMQSIAESHGKSVQEEALRACRASHSTSMWANAMEMAKADVNAHYSGFWSWANVVSKINYFAAEASKA